MKRCMTAGILVSLFTLLFSNGLIVFAHGGEDHGEQTPQTTASTKGTVIHTTRLGEIELMLKHPELLPDTATSGKLFLTRFETNEPVAEATAVIEIEGADGSITHADIEKTDDAGIFNVKIPAMRQGTYIVRAKITAKGESDTATFSGVEIRPLATTVTGSLYASARNILMGMAFLLIIGLFGILVYFIMRPSVGQKIDKEALSAG